MPDSGPAFPITTVLSQYGNSASMLSLIESWFSSINPAALFDSFYVNVWDIDTAVGYGLDLWGRIVGVSRVLTIPGSGAGPFQGMSEAGLPLQASGTPFGQAPFLSKGGTQNYALSDTAFRTLILLKAAANICRTTSPAINALLTQLFAGVGVAYVNDLGGMVMRVVVNFYPTTPAALQQVIIAILQQSGAVPHSAGVLVEIQTANPNAGTYFGFSVAGFPAIASGLPFGQAPFAGLPISNTLYNNGGVLSLVTSLGWPGVADYPSLADGAMWSNGGAVSCKPGVPYNPANSPIFFGSVTAASLLALNGAYFPTTDPGIGYLWNSGGEIWIGTGTPLAPHGIGYFQIGISQIGVPP